MLKAKSHFVPPPKLPPPTPVVDVGDAEMRMAQDLLFFAYRDFTNVADQVLEDLGLGRAHHRALHFIGRNPGITVSEQGYYSPTTNIKDVFPPDKYAFWYEGKPWKGAAERGIKEGDLRDGGSLETRAANVAYWHQWPDDYDHLIQKWD